MITDTKNIVVLYLHNLLLYKCPVWKLVYKVKHDFFSGAFYSTSCQQLILKSFQPNALGRPWCCILTLYVLEQTLKTTPGLLGK